MILNYDTVIDPPVLTELVKTAESGEDTGFVSGKEYYYRDPLKLQTVGRFNHPINLLGSHVGFQEYNVGQYDEIKEYDFIDDIFLLINRKVFDKVGGYDENFFLHWEETDWCARVRRAGFRILYTFRAKLWHKGLLTTLDGMTPLALFYLTRNQIPFMWRNANRSQFLAFTIILIFKKSARWIVRFIKKGEFDYLLSYIHGIFSGFSWILFK